MTDLELQGSAVAASNAGRHVEAITLFKQLVTAQPAEAAYHANLALAFARSGAASEAIASYRTAVSLRPNHAPTLAKLARVLAQAGAEEEASQTFRRAIAIDSGDADTWNALGALQANAEKLESATGMFRRALELDPHHEEAIANLTAALRKLGENAVAEAHWQAAEDLFAEALRLDPGNFDCQYNRALALAGAGKLSEAIECYRRALDIRPNDPRTLNNLSHLLLAQGKPEAAVAALEQALVADPDYLDAMYNLGAIRQHQGRFAEARARYGEVLNRKPDHADTHAGLGGMLLAEAKPAEAIAHLDRALQSAPNHYDARWNRALALLGSGDYRNGWPAYEIRLSRKGQPARHGRRPRWQGEDLAGRSLLVWAEQGLGDTIQFLRFLPRLSNRGVRVIFECQPRLLPLAACIDAIDCLVERDGPLPQFDYQAALMSLPAILRAELNDIPGPVPVQIPAERLAKWAHLAEGKAKITVGLCWAGNPHHPSARDRQLPLTALRQLTALSQFHFYSLQQASPENTEEIARLGISLVEAEENDILDTAAIIQNLDAVVTVDTMIAHLAASLGKPSWVLLPFAADWRWLLDRDDSPWYPAAKLIRQPKPGDWDSVLDRTREALVTELTPPAQPTVPEG